MSSAEGLAAVKAEIAFFMERAWQASIGYFAAVAATLALLSSDALEGLPKAIGTNRAEILALLALTANPLYLSAVIACLFATLKRGLFILKLGADTTQTDVRWERFVRGDGALPMSRLAWNIDNYYVVPTLLLIAASTCWAAWTSVTSDSTTVVVLGTVGIAFHVVPLVMAFYLMRLDAACQREADQSRIP